jgi:protoporphyrinogen oxidase
MSHPHSKQKRVVILGGGLAGLSALWHLQKAGYENCFLFEKESRIGGLTRSETVNGFTFDYTGHLLHFRDESIRKLVMELLGDNIHYVARNSWIFSKGVYTRYPFQTNLHGLPPDVIKECILGFVQATANGHRDGATSAGSMSTSEFQNFEEWIYSTLGSGIARHFMLPYNEKLWTVPLKELTCEWMGRFVPGTSLEQILDGALSDQSGNIGYNASFGYPLRGGIEALPRAFANSLRNVYSGFEVSQVDLEAKRMTFLNREQTDFDVLVSSMPMPALMKAACRVPTSIRKANDLLRFTSVYNVNLGVDRVVSDKHWIYFPEPEFIFYRVGFAHNFSPHQSPPGCSSIYAEVAYSPWKPIDKRQTTEQVKQDLIRSGILTSQDRLMSQLCLDIPCAYVLYDQRHRENVGLIRSYLERCGVRIIGRYGSWEYSGMEDAIRQGKTVAEELIQTH